MLHAGKMVKSKMALEDIKQIDLAKKLKVSQPYLSQRICGHSDFSRADMLAAAKELKITSGDEFLRTFFPEISWKDEEK